VPDESVGLRAMAPCMVRNQRRSDARRRPTMDHVGIDVHQKYSEICTLSAEAKVLKRQNIPTTETAMRRSFGRRRRARIEFECGQMSPRLYRLLRNWGHEVVVVNTRRVRLITESTL